ncbi:MAG: hypothetical protein WC289_01310 [Patescibacteria group bacterium]|jgi:hypothetical protein
MIRSTIDQYNWPGWPLKQNPYGKQFDLQARKRMVEGSMKLLPALKKFRQSLGSVVLEVGPFFNPLITPERYPRKTIFYWENDYHVLNWLQHRRTRNVHAVFCDLNTIKGQSLLTLKNETQHHFKKSGSKKRRFDSVVVSHVLNYIDYKLFLIVLKEFLKHNGLLFLNNVQDYGLPAFFSEHRPHGIPETTTILRQTGYEILYQRIIPSSKKSIQKHPRLIIVAKNIS